jgi:PKD repeat protein
VPATFGVSVTAGGAAVRTATISFGDGGTQSVSTSGLSTVTHTYGASGLYTVTAVATDAVGESSTAYSSVAVQAVTVNVTLSWSPATAKANAPVDFTATVTTNPAGVAVSRYQWFIDGTLLATTSGSTFSYIPVAAGTYEVKVRVETTSGASGEALRYVVVVTP